MKIILISPPDYIESESSLVNRMFKHGLPLLHLRKPSFGSENLAEYLDSIKQEYHSRIVIHSSYDLLDNFSLKGVHLTGVNSGEKRSIIKQFKGRCDLSISISYHSLDDLCRKSTGIDYAFLSPVFDSISKKNYKGGFDLDELSSILALANTRIIALGGCKAENLNQVKQLGFSGAAVLGAVWNTADPLSSYVKIKKAAGLT